MTFTERLSTIGKPFMAGLKDLINDIVFSANLNRSLVFVYLVLVRYRNACLPKSSQLFLLLMPLRTGNKALMSIH